MENNEVILKNQNFLKVKVQMKQHLLPAFRANYKAVAINQPGM